MNRQVDTRGAEAEDAIKDKTGWVTGGLTVEAGSDRGQAGSATGEQEGKRCKVLR